jgi:hypothetical protein
MKWARHVVCMLERKRAYRVFVEEREWRPLGRTRRRWRDNIKMDFGEVRWGRGAWIGSIWLRIGSGGGIV